MIHIALDLGTQTGFAVADHRVVLNLGLWKLADKDLDTHRARFLRLHSRLSALVRDVLNRDQELVVHYEKAAGHYPSIMAGQIWGAYWGITELVCAQFGGIETNAVAPSHIKKIATGRGNATKDEVRHVMRQFGYSPDTEDEADALAILMTGLADRKDPSLATLFRA